MFQKSILKELTSYLLYVEFNKNVRKNYNNYKK